mgnify:CR=1 FL=1
MKALHEKKAHKPDRRTRHIEFCPVTLSNNGKTRTGYLIDLSVEGAKIRLRHKDEGGLGLSLNEPVHVDIKTPYGPSLAEGEIVWAEEQENGTRAGLRFTRVPTDPGDPLRCLMDSALA